jgi:hypothetical protein
VESALQKRPPIRITPRRSPFPFGKRVPVRVTGGHGGAPPRIWSLAFRCDPSRHHSACRPHTRSALLAPTLLGFPVKGLLIERVRKHPPSSRRRRLCAPKSGPPLMCATAIQKILPQKPGVAPSGRTTPCRGDAEDRARSELGQTTALSEFSQSSPRTRSDDRSFRVLSEFSQNSVRRPVSQKLTDIPDDGGCLTSALKIAGSKGLFTLPLDFPLSVFDFPSFWSRNRVLDSVSHTTRVLFAGYSSVVSLRLCTVAP